jgi:hypothetical protein
VNIGATGTLVRAAAAVILSAAVVITTNRRSPTASGSDKDQNLVVRWRTAALAIAGLFTALWLVIACLRIRYPYELEWSGGSMLDHCREVLRGNALYREPSSGWFSFEYPPLYFYVSAFVMRFMGVNSYLGMRLVSCISTLLLLYVVYLWCARLAPMPSGRRSSWPYLAPAVFLAAYRFTGAWYDIERLDMLFMFLSVLGGYLLTIAVQARSSIPTKTGNAITEYGLVAASAAVFSLAFFTKQQAVLFVAGAIGALLFSGKWKHLALFSALSIVLDLAVVQRLNISTSGWFSYYCFHVPLANGIRKELALQFLLIDIPLVSPMVLCAVLALKHKDRENSVLSQQAPDVLFLSQVVMGVAGSFLSRAHWGGAENVLMAVYLYLFMLAGVLASRTEAVQGAQALGFYMLALVQMLVVIYRPDLQLPKPQNYAAGKQYQSLVKSLNLEGDVLCVDHGGVSAVPHFHLMALTDVYGSDKGTPASIVQALLDHRYAAIVIDALPDARSPLAVALETYPNIQKVNITNSWIITGFPTPSPGRSVYVMRPPKP